MGATIAEISAWEWRHKTDEMELSIQEQVPLPQV